MVNSFATPLSLHGSITWPHEKLAAETNELSKSAPAVLPFAVVPADASFEDSFDLPKWRAECEAELKKLRHQGRPPKRRNSKRLNSVRAQVNPVCSTKVPSVLLPVLPAEERARISEAIFSQQDELSHAVCRGNTAAVLAVRASCAAESARERQRRYRELGDEHRWQAVQWREQRRRRRQMAVYEHDRSQPEKTNKMDDAGAQILAGESNSRGNQDVPGVRRTSNGERTEWTTPGRSATFKDKFKAELAKRVNGKRWIDEDQVDLEQAFSFFTVRGTLLVPADRLLRLLLELGLSGSSKQERSAIEQLCNSGELTMLVSENAEGNHGNQIEGPAASTSAFRRTKPGAAVGTTAAPAVHFGSTEELVWATRLNTSRNSGEVRPQISFNGFSTTILPAVRQSLSEMRQDQHLNFYDRLLSQLPPETAGLTSDLFFKAVNTLGVDLTGARSALASFDAQSPLAGRGGALIDAEAFHELLMVADERALRKRRQQEREVQAKLGLPEDAFWDHRFELFRLHQTFLIYDDNNNGFLDGNEIKQLLKHVGFEPYREGSSTLVNSLIAEMDVNNDEKLSFREFLLLMKRIRGMQRSERRDLLQSAFNKQFKGPSRRGSATTELDTRTILRVLVDLGFQIDKVGNTEAVVKRAVEDFEMEHYSGDIRFPEFETLMQRILEALASRIAEKCGKEANALGLAREAVAEYQWAFDQLDADGSGSLDFSETWEAVQMNTGREPTESEMLDLYREVGINPEDELDIFNFMRLMKSASEQIFLSENEFTLHNVTPKRLRECLTFFPLSKKFVACVPESDLPEMVASYCDIERHANLRLLDPTPITNVRQLLEHAWRKAAVDHAAAEAERGSSAAPDWG